MELSRIKKFSAFPRGITSKHKSDFYYLNWLHSFRRENKLKSHKKLCKNKDFCGCLMPSEKHNTLEFNQFMKCDTLFMLILNLRLKE